MIEEWGRFHPDGKDSARLTLKKGCLATGLLFLASNPEQSKSKIKSTTEIFYNDS